MKQDLVLIGRAGPVAQEPLRGWGCEERWRGAEGPLEGAAARGQRKSLAGCRRHYYKRRGAAPAQPLGGHGSVQLSIVMSSAVDPGRRGPPSIALGLLAGRLRLVLSIVKSMSCAFPPRVQLP